MVTTTERWSVPVPDLEGPLDAGAPPAGAPRTDVGQLGYVVEEYFVDGEASAYVSPGGDRPDPSGRWEAEPVASAGYRTRLLVVRPRDPDEFNGTVLLNWQNVSAGQEPPAPGGGEALRGYAWVGVSAQEAGIYGRPPGMRGGGGDGTPLQAADPARYASLRHPGDQGSFDIFSQAVAAVRANGGTGPDPMGGLDVQRVLAVGGSQSAMRLVAYANALHRHHRVVDGFVLTVWEGRAPLLEEGSVGFGMRTALRDDLDAPVMVVNSEFEALGLFMADVADGPTTRIWEVAGAPHAPARPRPPGAGPPGNGWGPNVLTIRPVTDAAIRCAHRWCTEGVAAPPQPRLAFGGEGRPQLVRDASGNAVGGIRLPDLAAPVGEYRGVAFGTGRAPLFGAFRPYPDEVLAGRYRSRADYLAQWSAAVDLLVESGAVLPDDAAEMRARGTDVALPFP